MTTLLGATVVYGGQTTITGYINASQEGPGSANISSEDVENADGKVVSRLIFQVQPKLSLDLICTTGTLTEFVEGAMCTATGYTAYYVESCAVTLVKGAKHAKIAMTSIFA